MSDWKQPREVDQVTMVFPANVIGKFLPPIEEIPEEFVKGWMNDHWCRQAEMWFSFGVNPKKSTMDFKPEFDADDRKKILRQIQTCLGSYEPKHEHKMAGVGYLMSLWFDKLLLIGATPR